MAIGVIAPTGKWTGWDNDGNPAIGGLLYTYIAGTTTNLATYTDVALSVPNTNPVVLDSAGRASIYLTPLTAYKFVLKTALGVTLWTQDNITVAAVSDVVTRIVAGSGISIASTGAETGMGDVTVTASDDPNIASLAANDLIVAASSTQLGRVAAGTTGQLLVGATGVPPAWMAKGTALQHLRMNATAAALEFAARPVAVIGTTNAVTASIYDTWTTTGLTATIVPSAITSRVLVSISLNWAAVYESGHGFGYARLVRNGTAIYRFGRTDSNQGPQPSAATWLDSPALASAVVYHVEIVGSVGSGMHVIAQDGTPAESSVIVLLEIL
jgi:hypothetical protein